MPPGSMKIDVGFQGGSFSFNPPTQTPCECRDACVDYSGCVAFVWRTDIKKCSLKHAGHGNEVSGSYRLMAYMNPG